MSTHVLIGFLFGLLILAALGWVVEARQAERDRTRLHRVLQFLDSIRELNGEPVAYVTGYRRRYSAIRFPGPVITWLRDLAK